jgi:type II secretory pathway pseudopilin PulG
MGCRTMSGRQRVHGARRAARGGERGFTYLGALVLVVITGIGLVSAHQYWSTLMKREKEKELIFRGDQICRAIDSYYKATPQGRQPSYPSRLEDLLKDPRSLESRRHLRKLYTDPMTGGKWGIISDEKGGVKGVFSLSEKVPLKSGGFPAGHESFDNAKAYTDWKFVSNPLPAKAPQVAPPAETPKPQEAGAKG